MIPVEHCIEPGVDAMTNAAAIATAVPGEGPELTELAELAAKIDAKHQDVLRGIRQTLQDACEVGLLLEQAYARVPYGQWIPWVKSNCSFSYETSAIYRRLARRRDELPPELKTLSEAVTWLSKPKEENEDQEPVDLQTTADPPAGNPPVFPDEKSSRRSPRNYNCSSSIRPRPRRIRISSPIRSCSWSPRRSAATRCRT